MKPRWSWLLFGLLVAAGVGACVRAVPPPPPEVVGPPSPGAIVGEPADLTAVPEATDTPTPLVTSVPVSRIQGSPVATVTGSPTVSMPPDAALQGLVAQAREDLADRLSIAVDQISLTEVEAVEWPDASLGCPEPGKVYAQMVTSGYRIVLEAQ
jgi:hypothetical protein